MLASDETDHISSKKKSFLKREAVVGGVVRGTGEKNRPARLEESTRAGWPGGGTRDLCLVSLAVDGLERCC